MKLILSIALLFTLSSSFAAEDPCSADASKLCAPVLNDAKALETCLKNHLKILSSACKATLPATKGKKGTGDFLKDCVDEMAKFCKNLPPKSAKFAHCLKQNEAGLSDLCKNSLPEKLN